MGERANGRSRGNRRWFLIGCVGTFAVALMIGFGLLFGSNDPKSADLEASGSALGPRNAALESGPLSGRAADALASMLGLAVPPDGPVVIAPGVAIGSMTVNLQADGTITGSGVVTIGRSGLQLGMDAVFTDKNNWSLKANSLAASVFSPAQGISIDPRTISGSITKSSGEISWSLTGPTTTWSMTSDAALTTEFSLSTSCPFSDAMKCPSVGSEDVYLGMPNATLRINGIPNTLVMAGGLGLAGEWSRLEGTVGDVNFAETTISDTQLVAWKGERKDSFDPSMVLPDLSSQNNGANFEFCGKFSISIPSVTNKSTSGCVRWSPVGIVLAQAGGGTTIDSSITSTDSSGASVSEPVSADVKGLAWTNLPNAASFEVAFDGVAAALNDRAWTLSGIGHLPGVAAKALGLDSQAVKSLDFEVRGSFSATTLEVSGDVPVSLKVGSEPFKLDVQSVRATISAAARDGASFSLGTTTDVTLGYAPNSRVIKSQVSLSAATAPSFGMVLSLSAAGAKAPEDAGVTGVTSSSRLIRPDLATYIWPDQFGVRGLNLFSLAAEVGWVNGSPVVSYSSSAYLNPEGADMKNVIRCRGACDPKDWMISTLAVSASLTNPCFAYGFDGSAGGSTLAIDGGTLRTSVFKVGMAPTGCQIQSGGETQSLPAGFFGFQFTAQMGSASFDVATQVSAQGFNFRAVLKDLDLGGLTYPRVELTIKINSAGSEVSFTGRMTSTLGKADVSAQFTANSWGLTQTLKVSVTDWAMGKAGTMDIPEFNFKTDITIPFSGNCGNFSASAYGKMVVQKKTYNLTDASFSFKCGRLDRLTLAIKMEHQKATGGTATEEFRLNYGAIKMGSNSLYKLEGGAKFSYRRSGSWELYGQTFSRDIQISIYVDFFLFVDSPWTASFDFGGRFDAERVSGSIDCEWKSDGNDFSCRGDLRLNPSWADVYYKSWSGL